LRIRTLSAALAVALLVGVSFVVFQLTRSKGINVNLISKENASKNIVPEVPPKTLQVDGPKQDPANVEAVATGPASRNMSGRRVVFNNRNKRATAVAEFSFGTAPVVRDSRSTASSEAVFPVDASQQSLKVSLFDSRGNPKTISLPSVSFGSQRVVPTTTSFAQKGVW
jgi:hypothetical protein